MRLWNSLSYCFREAVGQRGCSSRLWVWDANVSFPYSWTPLPGILVFWFSLLKIIPYSSQTKRQFCILLHSSNEKEYTFSMGHAGIVSWKSRLLPSPDQTITWLKVVVAHLSHIWQMWQLNRLNSWHVFHKEARKEVRKWCQSGLVWLQSIFC